MAERVTIPRPEPARMGIGLLGGPNTIYKRKFRWTFRVDEICMGQAGGGRMAYTSIPEFFVKAASRPSLEIEETELNYQNAKMWIPGKGAWNHIELTYYDVATTALQPLWQWLCSVYNLCDTSKPHIANRTMGSRLSDYTGKGTLTLFDGCGAPLESWVISHCWPKTIDFGDLNYADSDICEVKLTLRYIDVAYQSWCPPGQQIDPCCTPCV